MGHSPAPADTDSLKFLGFEQIFKNALTGRESVPRAQSVCGD